MPGTSDIDVLDLSDPAAIELVNSVNVMGYGIFGQGAILVDDRLLIRMWDLFDSRYWWDLYDLADPVSPLLVGELGARGDVNYESGDEGLAVHRLLPRGVLEPLGVFWPDTACGAVTVGNIPPHGDDVYRFPRDWEGDLLAVSHFNRSTWELWDVSEPALPEPLHTENVPGDRLVRAMAIADGALYVADRRSLAVWDIATPSAPARVVMVR